MPSTVTRRTRAAVPPSPPAGRTAPPPSSPPRSRSRSRPRPAAGKPPPRRALAAVAALLVVSAAVTLQNRRLRAALAGVADLLDDGLLAAPPLAVLAAAAARPRPGVAAARAGVVPHHPVVIVPGFVTSSLELWQGPPCAAPYFRSRFWGGLSMTQRVLTAKDCWLDVMRLDDATGLDPTPPNATHPTRLRAVESLAGVDYFLPGYGVWAALVAELAALGYHAGNLAAEPYDWRLAVADLERRDGYFTRLAARVETSVAVNGGVKVALVAHSWGDTVTRTFLAWADAARAPGWVDAHVAHYVNIAGPTLGTAKSVPALLSGETRDTAELGAVAAFLSDNFVPRRERTRLFRSWGGSLGMLPLGGARVWGNATSSPDDGAAMILAGASYGALLTANGTALDAAAAVDAVLATLPRARAAAARATWFDGGTGTWPAAKCGAVGAHGLHCPLPAAPALQVTCLYGVGKPTERAYFYTGTAADAAAADVDTKIDTRAASPPPGGDVAAPLMSAGDPSHPLGGVDAGVRLGDGDGTVNLGSLGALCARGWRAPRLNPAGVRVVTREARHAPLDLLRSGLDPRGGPRSADHVDVLAHADVVADVVAIVGGRGGGLEDRFYSNVRDIAARMDL